MADASRKFSGIRLSRLLHAVLIASLVLVIGFRVWWYFASTASETRSTGDSLATADASQWHEAAGKAFVTEDWNLAADACEKIVAEEPYNAQAWARLAYAQHQLGRYDRAIAAYLRLCQWEGRRRQWAMCNIAAVYALKNEKQMALDYLQEAVEAGFRQPADERPVAENPDFRSIADDPEFQRLAEMTKPISQRSMYRQLDFLLGQWILMGADDRRLGTAEFAAASGGYAIIGTCTDDAAATTTTILAYADPATSQWRQVWLDDQGNVSQLTGQTSYGESLVFEGETIMADGRRCMARVELDVAADGRTHLTRMSSSDGGNQWTELLDASLVPLEAKPPKTSLAPTASPR